MPEHCASSESLPALEKTFELLAVLLIGRPILGVCDRRARVLAFDETKHLTVAEYWLNTHQDPFGIHSLTITQNESPASFFKKVFIGLETEHIQLFMGRNSETMFKHSHKLGVWVLLRGCLHRAFTLIASNMEENWKISQHGRSVNGSRGEERMFGNNGRDQELNKSLESVLETLCRGQRAPASPCPEPPPYKMSWTPGVGGLWPALSGWLDPVLRGAL